jgi:hypothetical protein
MEQMKPYKWKMKTIVHMQSNEACIISSKLGYGMQDLGDTIHPSICDCKVISCARHYVKVKLSKGKANDLERVL